MAQPGGNGVNQESIFELKEVDSRQQEYLGRYKKVCRHEDDHGKLSRVSSQKRLEP